MANINEILASLISRAGSQVAPAATKAATAGAQIRISLPPSVSSFHLPLPLSLSSMRGHSDGLPHTLLFPTNI